METENSQNVFSVSITHNSKIRELSDGNRIMETELSFAKQPFCHGSHHFWVMSYGNWELSCRNSLNKQPLSVQNSKDINLNHFFFIYSIKLTGYLDCFTTGLKYPHKNIIISYYI